MATKKPNRCGKTQNLQTSHVFSRRHMSVRWEPLNATCLDAGCHWRFTLNPIEHTEFIMKLLGPQKFAALKGRKDTIIKGLTPAQIKESWT